MNEKSYSWDSTLSCAEACLCGCGKWASISFSLQSAYKSTDCSFWHRTKVEEIKRDLLLGRFRLLLQVNLSLLWWVAMTKEKKCLNVEAGDGMPGRLNVQRGRGTGGKRRERRRKLKSFLPSVIMGNVAWTTNKDELGAPITRMLGCGSSPRSGCKNMSPTL